MNVQFDLKLITSIVALIVSIIPKTPVLVETDFYRLSKFTQSLLGYLRSYGTITGMFAVFFLLINTFSEDMNSAAIKQIYYNITYRISFGIIFLIIFLIFLSAFFLFLEIKVPPIRRWILLRNLKYYLDNNI